MPTADERIAALEAKLKQAKERKRKSDARVRAAESKRERRADTRRKILAGALLMQRAEHDADAASLLRSMLANNLTRDDDRALFDLEPLPGDAPDTNADERAA